MFMATILSHCTVNSIQAAAKSLLDGALVAFPTETVYGLGVDATNEKAVKRMYEVKSRPSNHPVIIHLATSDQVDYWATEIPEYAISLMRNYWPGPMTLLLKRSKNAKDFITGGQELVGLRVPDHPVALALLSEFKQIGGRGVAAPSANRFGSVSPTDANAVSQELKSRLSPSDLILDGGPCSIGVESTIIDCTGEHPVVLRPGAITIEMIESITGERTQMASSQAPRASGLLEKHYSPKAKVKISNSATADEGFIAEQGINTPAGAVRLASPSTLEEYARQLYAALRKADDLGLASVSVVPPQGQGLALAIRDRINRAAG
jgi:L-threonylcarbamoyladenylate synthase